jgi:hypothetical protein
MYIYIYVTPQYTVRLIKEIESLIHSWSQSTSLRIDDWMHRWSRIESNQIDWSYRLRPIDPSFSPPGELAFPIGSIVGVDDQTDRSVELASYRLDQWIGSTIRSVESITHWIQSTRMDWIHSWSPTIVPLHPDQSRIGSIASGWSLARNSNSIVVAID